MGKPVLTSFTSQDEGQDDDSKAIEIVFDPTNPHRRKSSLASADARQQMAYRHRRRDECLIHQFLESQVRLKHNHHARAVNNGVSDSSQTPEGPVKETDGSRSAPDNLKLSLNTNAGGSCRAVIDTGGSDGHEPGQPDQEAWRREMMADKAPAEVDHFDEVGSRMVTKKQLSDMAWGVRELSRRLSSMRVKFNVQNIFILVKPNDVELVPKARQLTRWLLSREREIRYNVYLESKFRNGKRFDLASLIEEVAEEYVTKGGVSSDSARESIESRVMTWDDEMCRSQPHMFDFVITLGGDGTVLYASWLFQRIMPPVLSFSLGSLGFLTKFDFDKHESILASAFRKGVTVSLRLRFQGTIMRSQCRQRKQLNGGGESEGANPDPETDTDTDDELHRKKRDLVEELVGEESEDAHTHRPDKTYQILNEIVVDRGPNPTMSYTEIFGDDEHFTSVLADGICVSTPTGSTAYNLAAGGSLCHPDNPVMLVTSICPHTLSFRPIILPDTIVLRVGVPYNARTNSWVSFDGRERLELFPGDYVTINASRYPFATVQTEGRRSEDFVNTISGKLGWNTRQKQKEFSG